MFGLTSASYRRPGMWEGRGEQISERSSCSSGRSWSPSAESATSSAVPDLKSRQSLGKTKEWNQSRCMYCTYILLPWQWSKQVQYVTWTKYIHNFHTTDTVMVLNITFGFTVGNLPYIIGGEWTSHTQNPLTVGIPQVNPFCNVQVRLLSRHSRQCQEANRLSV